MLDLQPCTREHGSAWPRICDSIRTQRTLQALDPTRAAPDTHCKLSKARSRYPPTIPSCTRSHTPLHAPTLAHSLRPIHAHTRSFPPHHARFPSHSATLIILLPATTPAHPTARRASSATRPMGRPSMRSCGTHPPSPSATALAPMKCRGAAAGSWASGTWWWLPQMHRHQRRWAVRHRHWHRQWVRLGRAPGRGACWL